MAPSGPTSVWAMETCNWVDRQLASTGESRTLLTGLADHLGLSADRTRHRFANELGLPFRRFVPWARLRRAVVLMQQCTDLARAAHEAGFADAAHLGPPHFV